MIAQQNETDILEREINKLIAEGPVSKTIQELKERLLTQHKSSETRFRKIFDQSRFGNKIINADLCIIQVNNALVKLLGYTAKELIGSKIIDIAHPDFVKDWKELQLGLWTQKHDTFSIDTCLLKKNKEVLWCRVTSIVFQDNGDSYGYTIIEDISDRKNLERIRAEVDAKKDEFIRIVSHELKTPLTTIKAINQLLQKAVNKDHTYYSFIKKSNHHISRLERLVADLFDVTKITEGTVTLNLNSFNMDLIIQECISDIQAIHPTHEIQYHSVGIVNVKADQFRIEQVIINLINNAIKYSPSSNIVEVKLIPAAKDIRIEVKDFGIGIANKNLNKIFERYYRVEEIPHHFQGLGLGLYIASQIIEKHSGSFGVESELGIGSTIWFSLPLNN